MRTLQALTISGFFLAALSLPTWVEAQNVPLTAEGKVPGQPFQFLQNQIDELKQQVAALQATGANRVIFSGTIGLNSQGNQPDETVRETVDNDVVKRLHYFKVFAIPELTTDDPPALALFRRPRTDTAIGQNIKITSDFLLAGIGLFGSQADTDATLIILEPGRILLRFRRENLDKNGNVTNVRYGLDGPGGTGDFRLVVIR